MNIKKRFTIFILAIAMIMSFIPTLNVKAATADFKIISDSKVSAKQAEKWAKSKGATNAFIDLADLYFKYAPDHGDVNPGIAYVQAAKETGYGKFGGVLDESYHNPCGLKNSTGGSDTDPNAHKKFNSWDEGVQAHLDHLALYAGAKGYPKDDSYDPRQFKTLKGTATTLSSLGAKWAPSSTYGDELSKLYKDLLDYAGVDYPKDNDSDSKNNSSSQTSNSSPNPGKPESKPNGPKIADVIAENKPENINKSGDDKPNITSSNGWKNEDGNWYYYKSDNTKATGWIKPDSSWYYLNDDGKMATGWITDNGKWYYMNSSGSMAKGWKQLNGNWYFLTNSGAMAVGIQYDNSSLYYFKDSGVMATNNGWANINNKWYYFEDSGKIYTGWLKDDSKWYYLQGDGSMVTGFNRIGGKIYVLNNSGDMETGWVQSGGNWYYFNTDGSMATGWITDNRAYYYLYDNGVMARGWVNLSGSWYYLKDGGTMATGWVTSNGDSYYLDLSSGKLLTNTTVDNYKIGSDGKRQNSSSIDDSSNSSSNNDTSNNPPPISNNNGNTSKGSKTIVVDAGHDYGKDYGAESTIDGVTYSETVLNMQVADKLKTELQNRGYNVIMTRNMGEKPSYGSLMASLTHRVNVANSSNADFYISIHHNSAGETAHGVLSLYSSETQDDSFGGKSDSARIEKSKQIATLINNNIASKLNLYNRGGQEQNLFVCRNTNMPAVLVEVGFITNKEEAIRCADSASQQKVAEAIAEVIASNI